MKYNTNQEREYIREQHIDIINKNLLENYKKLINGENIKYLIKNHRKCIINMNLKKKYKNTYYTLSLLEHYQNTKNKSDALMHLTNAISNKVLFTKFLSEEEKKEMYWNRKGIGKYID